MRIDRTDLCAKLTAVALCLLVLLSGAAVAQEGRAIQENRPAAVRIDTEKPKIAFWLQIDGCRYDKTKEKIIPAVYRDVFCDFEIVPAAPVDKALNKLGIRKHGGRPADHELLKVGRALGVDYMLYAGMKVHTKRVFINICPRAKSSVKIDTVVVDVKQKKVVYDPAKQVGFSQGGGNEQLAVAWLVYTPASWFMGGHRDKVEEKAVTSTIEDCYSHFLEKLRGKERPIEG